MRIHFAYIHGRALMVGLALISLMGPSASAIAALPEIRGDELARIEKALPESAPGRASKPRRLLIFTRNVGYGGHPSMAHAAAAFTLMGKHTGAFQTVVSDDLAVFERDSLKSFHAVLFNNTVGNCFTNRDLRQNLMEFIMGGGGLMGVHGSSVAFTHWPGAIEDWPEFGYSIGARGANHKASDEQVWMRVEEHGNPITHAFDPSGFSYKDEFFRVHEPYSRKRVRVLLSMDTNRTDVSAGKALGNCYRADGDYALAWIRNHGRGRTFYSTIAHNPYVFWDPMMLKFYLAAAQFALGDLAVPTTPSAWLSPAVRAQEKLNWKLGIEAYSFHKYTFFEGIIKSASLGVPYVGGLSFQKVGGRIDKNFDPSLNDDELEQIRLKLHEAGLRLLTYYIHDLPAEETACRPIFEFGRKMGIETFISEPKLAALPTIAKLCDEYDIRVGLHNHDAKASPDYWNPEKVLAVCQGLTARIGAAADTGYWMRAGVDPVEGIRKLGPRLITIQMHDLNGTGAGAHDVPWGTGVANVQRILETTKQSGAKPTMIGLEYSHNFTNSMPDVEKCVTFYNRIITQLAQ